MRVANAKGVVPYRSFPTDFDPWDGPAEIREADVDDLRLMSAWFDDENPDIKSSYKLPHHRTGSLVISWRGLVAAMAALNGARTRVAIPERDRRATWEHLARHYREDFDAEPPELRANIMTEIVYKHFTPNSPDLEIKADIGARLVEGLASTFGNVDAGGDVIEPGAFKRTLKRRKGRIVHLWQHDAHQPIGKPEQLTETDKGLSFVSRIASTPRGDEALQLHAEKVIKGISIGFMLSNKDFTLHDPDEMEDGRRRTIKRVSELWEYSSVTFPMNSRAAVTSVTKYMSPEQIVAMWAEEQKHLGSEAFSKAAIGKLEQVASAILDMVRSVQFEEQKNEETLDTEAVALAMQFGCMELSTSIKSLGRKFTG